MQRVWGDRGPGAAVVVVVAVVDNKAVELVLLAMVFLIPTA